MRTKYEPLNHTDLAQEVDRIILVSTTWVYGRNKGVVDENTHIPFPEHRLEMGFANTSNTSRVFPRENR